MAGRFHPRRTRFLRRGTPERQFGHHAQNDRWIADAVFPGLRDGFFVEAGACRGLGGSATRALERDLGWHGICVEPLPYYYRTLIRNRACRTDPRCLWSASGEQLRFLSYVEGRARSGVQSLNNNGAWAARNDASEEIELVESVTLADLLAEHDAPPVVHYLCLDIEGAERTVLESFDFSPWTILALSVEGGTCDDVLLDRGYRRVDNQFAPAPVDLDHYFLHPSV
jgi:FkbM family methyltransferase